MRAQVKTLLRTSVFIAVVALGLLPAEAGANFLLSEAAPCVLGAEKGVPVINRWNQPNPVTS